MSSENTESHPSMLRGHAEYIAGATKETIGNLSGSEPWTSAGQSEKSAAIDEMRAARQAGQGETQNPTVAKAEGVIGNAVGCEGMVEEGKKVGGS